jgi:hypothetical protein
VDAPCPAAGPFLSLQQFFTGSINTALARPRLFRIIDPADELIPAKRRQAFPQSEDFRIRLQGRLEVFACFMHSAMGKRICHETSTQCRPTVDFIRPGKAAFEFGRGIRECPPSVVSSPADL